MVDAYSSAPIRSDVGAVLVDFDNWCRSLDDLNEAWIGHELNLLVRDLLTVSSSVKYVNIRLYGGWHEEGQLTQKASQVLAAIGSTAMFPVKHPMLMRDLLRGDIELATRLVASRQPEWLHTRKSRGGLPRLRLAAAPFPVECESPDAACPVRAVNRFTSTRYKTCPMADCSVTNEQAFRTVEQKMVDTLLVCDTIALSTQSEVRCVMVVSNDADILPGVVMAATTGMAQIVLRRDEQRSIDAYDADMDTLGVILNTVSKL